MDKLIKETGVLSMFLTTIDMKEKEVSIYKLLDPRDNSIKYIGKSCNISGRLACHISEARKPGKKNKRASWIKSLLVLDLKPILEVIEVCENNTVASEREKYYISFYKDSGIKNDQPGGDGNPPGYQIKNRYTPPKGEIPKNFKGLPHPSTFPNWKEIVAKQQANRKPPTESPKLRKPVIMYDLLEEKQYNFDSAKAASKFSGVPTGDICSRCKGKLKCPYKERYNFSYRQDGVNKSNIKRTVEVVRYNDMDSKEYRSILQASRDCNIKRDTIYKYLDTNKPDKYGYFWKTK